MLLVTFRVVLHYVHSDNSDNYLRVMSSQIGIFKSAHNKGGHVVDANKQLERIRITKFSGGKKGYQSWWAAFSSCVDETSQLA